ncbi:hypothetical protein BpHYR1_015901 [Brachionus plicatilis]|uniref:Uncharacterized protein n=1 Tax=Brachionus plicatilis TaxID=10195 RepID=A0A3M7RTP0_BRAPC|nr:hypothetical protein BpHYR1_015901 [Brachionus plicatilis]
MLEFGISLYVFLGILINSKCRQLPQVCTNFLDLSKLFYLLSCSQNTIVYCFLNESFRNRLILRKMNKVLLLINL